MIPEDEGTAEVAIEWSRIQALIFDVDGTLYDDRRLRRALRYRVVRDQWYRPWRMFLIRRVLRQYGCVLESLRGASLPIEDLARTQLELTSRNCGVNLNQTGQSVKRWMEDEPVALMRRFAHKGLMDVLLCAKSRGLRLGVLSDYPASRKLHSLCLDHLFEAVVSSRDPHVGRLKPHPRGLEVLIERLGVSRSQTVYVGDRLDVDTAAAAAAGMHCVILTPHRKTPARTGWVEIQNYFELLDMINLSA